MSNLPASFCIDIVAEKEHKRLQEFKDYMIKKSGHFSFALRYYGFEEGYSGQCNPFGTLLTLDQFFSLLNPKIYTISDLSNGVCAVVNDGTREELRKVLAAAFPNCNQNAAGSETLYYRDEEETEDWDVADYKDLPTQSVNLFLAELDGKEKESPYKNDAFDGSWDNKPEPITSINVGDEAEQFDNVNSPKHYTSGKVECIDAIESAISELKGMDAFCTGNAIKYSWRWKQKGGIEDLEKAVWYINKLIELNTK